MSSEIAMCEEHRHGSEHGGARGVGAGSGGRSSAEDPPRAAPPLYLDVRPFVACVVQTTVLSNHFDPQNELLGSVRKRERSKIVLGKGESTTTMTVRLQQACHRVDEVCAHPLTEFELKEHMENILVKSTEIKLSYSALSGFDQDILHMLFEFELCERVSAYLVYPVTCLLQAHRHGGGWLPFP
jgi:hypothetical protein